MISDRDFVREHAQSWKLAEAGKKNRERRRGLQGDPAAEAAGAMKVIPLSVAGAFHTSLMQPAVDALRAALEEIPIQDTRIPVYSNVDAKPHQSASEIRDLLSRQVVGSVRWEDSVRQMLEDGIDGFEEVGTGRVLRGTLKRINRKLPSDGFGDG